MKVHSANRPHVIKTSLRDRLIVTFFISLCLFSGSIFAETLEARLHWVQRVALGTPVSGVIAEVTAIPGTRVKKGERLLQLDVRPLQARIVGLEAERIGKQNDRDEAERELGRTQELYERTLLADRDLALAKIALATAEASLKTTEAQLIQAQWDLEFSQIRAPFAAWVIKRRAEPGQSVISNLQAEPLIVVARANEMLARAEVAGERLSSLTVGQSVSVNVGGKVYPGKLQHISLEPEANGKYQLDVKFSTAGRLLRAGLPAQIELP